MWTLFVYQGPIGRTRVARQYDAVMVEADSVPHAEERFRERLGRTPLAMAFRGYSAATKDEAWRRMREASKRNLPQSMWSTDEFTCSHLDHWINRSRQALVLPKVQREPGNSLRCSGCGSWHSWVDPNQPDGSYKCTDCRDLPHVGW